MDDHIHELVRIRSVLSHHVESMLEYMQSKKEHAKNESEDIFAIFDDAGIDESIRWDMNVPLKTQLRVLQEEKNALGVYMSGKPLDAYLDLLQVCRTVTSMGEMLHIAVIDKVKKVFTKANAMMFALTLMTTEYEIEGVIFSRDAMKYSPELEEGKVYWVLGRVDDPSQRKAAEKKQNDIPALESGEGGDADDTTGDIAEPIHEYVEKPKMLISHVTKFEKGFLEFLKTSDQPPTEEFIASFPDINWEEAAQSSEISNKTVALLSNLSGYTYANSKRNAKPFKAGFNSSYKKKNSPSDENQIANTPSKKAQKMKVTLYKSLGNRIAAIKKHIITTPKEGYIPIELWVELEEGTCKKVKGDFWMPLDIIQS